MKKKREVNYDKIGFITSKICLLLGLLIDIIAIIGLFKITTFSYHFTYYIYFPSLLELYMTIPNGVDSPLGIFNSL